MKEVVRLASAIVCLVVLGCGRAHDAAPDAGGMNMPDANADTGVEVASSKCPSAVACGGNLLGIWNIKTACIDVDLSSFTADCPSSKARAVDYRIAGAVTFNVDMTYGVVATMTGKVVLELPADCLTPPSGVQITCAQLQPALLAPGKYQTVDCTVREGGGCDCELGMMPQSLSGNGQYTVKEGVLTELTSKGTADADFCVTEDATTMTLSSPPGAEMLAAQGVTAGSVTLEKL